MKKIPMLPSLLTLANFTVGLLAIAKGIDALVLLGDPSENAEALFYRKLESACLLIFLGMLFDALDGKVARLMNAMSDFGAQLDSFADALTFGVAPALLAKVVIDGEGLLQGTRFASRITFMASAVFAVMAILRLARFNLETDLDEASHRHFRGLPSPAAAGVVVSTLWLVLILRRPELEMIEGTPTPLGRLMHFAQGIDWDPILAWYPTWMLVALPGLGLLMVSRVRYAHLLSSLTRAPGQFITLVWIVLAMFLVFLAPVPALFVGLNGYVLWGLFRTLIPAGKNSQVGEA